MTRARQGRRSALALCVVLIGCKAIVGIEERHVDPSLAAGADGGADAGKSRAHAGSGGHGGSGTSARSGEDGGVGNDASADGGADAATDDGAVAAQPDGGADAGADAMSPPPTTCQLYCATVLENCTDQYAVYASRQLCEGVCARLPEGDLAAQSPTGNSVACRLDQARLAGVTQEPWDHCPRAGPGGAGVCGENCESYCMLDAEFCPDNSDPACLTKCPALRDLDDEPRNFDDSTFDVVKHHDGDYLQCRLVHVSSASAAPLAHCWHAALAPKANPDPAITESNPCADPPDSTPRCEDYCRLNFGICTGDVAEYESEAQCLKVCGAMDKGTSDDPGGQNTVGCRKNHSYNALLGGLETHCPHSGPGGHNVCGSNCESYCREVASACASQFATKFADADACVAECNGLSGHDDPYTVALGKAGTNKLACRMLHTARAFSAANECPTALGGGDCQ